MDALQIIVVILMLVLVGVGLVLGQKKLKEASKDAADGVEKVVIDYTDTIIQITKDIILIAQIKREYCDTQEDYEQILMRMVARQLTKVIYDDMEIDERFKEIINEETLLKPLLFLYHKYEELILDKVKEEEVFTVATTITK